MDINFKEIYQKSISKPEEFWSEISNDIFWFQNQNIQKGNSKIYESKVYVYVQMLCFLTFPPFKNEKMKRNYIDL